LRPELRFNALPVPKRPPVMAAFFIVLG